MATNTQFRLKGKSRDSYLELVLDFPLASIKSEAHFAEAQRVMDKLLARGKLDEGAEMYLDALSDLVGSYEDEQHAIEPASDADMLRNLLDAKGVSPNEIESGHGAAKVDDFGSIGREKDVQSTDDVQAGRVLPRRYRRACGKYLADGVTAARFEVDLGYSFATNSFGYIIHFAAIEIARFVSKWQRQYFSIPNSTTRRVRYCLRRKGTEMRFIRMIVQRLNMFTVLVMSLNLVPLFAQTPGPDWVKVTPNAAWRARDSSGEVVYKGRLWLFGGWYDSFQVPPRDVWSSADGAEWTLVEQEAPWKYSDLPMTITFADRMWFMGGWTNGRLAGHGATNEVWSSSDGKTWELKSKAQWSPRIAAAVVEFKGRMWLLGGTENYYFGGMQSLKNDVWSSADGKQWTLETAAAGWSPRAYHQAAVLNDKIYVFGGGNYVPLYSAVNDVWSSSDGKTWERATEHADWSPRLWFSSAVYRDRMWVLGGWSNNPSKNWGDVWHSRDGRDWQQLKSNVIWKERHEHSTYVFQDKLWVAAGHAQPLSNEVWSLELPKDFFQNK